MGRRDRSQTDCGLHEVVEGNKSPGKASVSIAAVSLIQSIRVLVPHKPRKERPRVLTFIYTFLIGALNILRFVIKISSRYWCLPYLMQGPFSQSPHGVDHT